MKKIIAITGQTATGKTKLAIDLAQKHDGELINFDSRQIYKKLDIITGKDLHVTDRKFHLYKQNNNLDIGYYNVKLTTYNLQPTTKLWLYDIAEPNITFSSHDFRICALELIRDIFNRDKTPILVGGTYLYLHHLLYDFSIKVPPDKKLREELNTKSVEELQSILTRLDQEVFNSLNNSDKQNPHRLIRKIEIAKNNKTTHEKVFSYKPTLQDFLGTEQETEIILLGLHYTQKDTLRSKIQSRVKERLKENAVEEVESLLDNSYTKNDPGLQTIGYKQIIQYLSSEISYEEMRCDWVNKEVQYAKRQYTFMKKNPHITWYNPLDNIEIT